MLICLGLLAAVSIGLTVYLYLNSECDAEKCKDKCVCTYDDANCKYAEKCKDKCTYDETNCKFADKCPKCPAATKWFWIH